MIRLALFQPDQPPNVGTLLRLGACLGVPVDIIEPCGFAFSREAVRRAALDYFDNVDLTAHADYCAFDAARRQAGRRLVLLTSKGDTPYSEAFTPRWTPWCWGRKVPAPRPGCTTPPACGCAFR